MSHSSSPKTAAGPPNTADAPPSSRFRLRLRREHGLLFLLLLILIGLSLGVEQFGTPRNTLRLLRDQAHLMVLAAGMTVVILTGGIDLSVGSIVALAAVAMGLVWKGSGQPVLALLAALGVGAGCGAINGALVSAGRVPPLIVTLATLSVFRGAAYALAGSETLGQFPPAILGWSRTDFPSAPIPFFARTSPAAWGGGIQAAGIPVPLWIVLLIFIGVGVYLTSTDGGRAVFAVGSNPAASRLSGVPTSLLRFRVYLFSGLVAGLAAIMYAADYNSARADIGADYELMAITMVVLGGTSVSGGDGSILGTALAALALLFLRNGMTLQNELTLGPIHVALTELQGVVVAVLLVGALLLDARVRQRLRGA